MMRRWLLCGVVASVGCGDGDSGGQRDVAIVDDADSGEEIGANDVVDEPPRVITFEEVRITSQEGPNFQNARYPITLSPPYASARLRIELDTTCYPFERWQDNPPPQGHNWPADCDAFDRNFEVILEAPDGAQTELPSVELIRAITPFGGPLTIEADVTEVANAMPGEHQLRVHVTTWSDGAGQVSGSNGGWFVSGELELEPGAPDREVLSVVPLFNGWYASATEALALEFEVPEGASDAWIEYRVTGHGGGSADGDCIGPAEEFCRRYHYVGIDGEQVLIWEPWRDDCADFCTLAAEPFEHCEENPCGAIGSVRAPRANWCPGSVTPAEVIRDERLLTPGPHTMSVEIEDIAEGGSWRVSATLFVVGEVGSE